MLFVWIALWAVAFIVWLSDPKSSVNRWLSLLSFSGGAGALAVTLDTRFIPYMVSNYPNATAQQALYEVQAYSSLFCYYGVPYTFLLFALAYRPIQQIERKLQRWLPLYLLIPIIGFVTLTPGYNDYTPITYTAVVWWAVPCFLIGTVLILSKPSGHAISHAHWIICFAVLTPALFAMIFSYVLPSLGKLGLYMYNVWFVTIGVVIFGIGLFSYGFLGIRVLIERRRLESTLQAVTSGTAILHHAIKNDVGKMRLFGQKMQAYAESTNQPELLEDVRTMMHASGHIQEMISRVHRRTEDLEVRPTVTDISQLIVDTLKPYEPVLKGIKLKLQVADRWMCTLDQAQVGEAINNLISNAIEAMNGSGELTVSFIEHKRDLTVEIRDSGPGMSKQQAHKAMEPFYTTKKSRDANFGLGLPYAYFVMRKHGGTLQIRSKVGAGTVIFLIFPKRSVKAEKVSSNISAGGVVRG
ncbi:MAG: HAMP domain-containing sensor histidine kinase [Candidatus Cohnella colombiensis]|uniref:histidine kinase n=1 Tax=Candidatus Cohnella colombiensis TaxID=3121368 RepID=A0AA95EYV2_9BACL|nr:MAG: HAMP domain-containing sensor histidine kinase [Cohnella sp.]